MKQTLTVNKDWLTNLFTEGEVHPTRRVKNGLPKHAKLLGIDTDNKGNIRFTFSVKGSNHNNPAIELRYE